MTNFVHTTYAAIPVNDLQTYTYQKGITNIYEMAMLFDIDKSGISKHIKNIYADGELDPTTTGAKIATVVNRGIRGEVEDELDIAWELCRFCA